MPAFSFARFSPGHSFSAQCHLARDFVVEISSFLDVCFVRDFWALYSMLGGAVVVFSFGS
jgi:hypothetical protein